MAQQEGPFSSYLDYMQKPIAPAPTGLEGTGMGIANIAMNFLQGLRQGRAQKYMQKEAEESRKEQLLLNAMQTVQRSGMLPEAKAQYEARIQQEFAKRVAGVKEGSKDTGNPLTDFFKRAGMSLIGGQPPGGKKADLDMNVALEAFAAASDPKNSVNEALRGLDMQAGERYRQLVKEAEQSPSGVLTDVMLQSDKQMQALDNEYRRIGRPDQSPIARLARGTPSASSPYMMWQQQQKILEQERKAEAKEALFSASLEEGNRLTDDIIASQSRVASEIKYPALTPKRGENIQVIDNSGKLRTAFSYSHPRIGGVYDANTREKLEGARKATVPELKAVDPQVLTDERAKASDSIKSLFAPGDRSIDIYVSRLGNLTNVKDIHRVVDQAVNQQLKQAAMDFSREKFEKLIEQKKMEFAKDVYQKVQQGPAQKSLRQIDNLYQGVNGYLPSEDTVAKYAQENGVNQSKATIAFTSQMAPMRRNTYHKALVALAAKAMDSDTAVREGELKYWGDSSAAFEAFNKYTKTLNEGVTNVLTDEQEEELLKLVKIMYKATSDRAKEEKEGYAKALISADVNPDTAYSWVGLRTTPLPERAKEPAQSPQGATPANRPAPAGYTPPGTGRKVAGYNPGAK